MPRKPKPIPLPRLAQFDTMLTALLAVKKDELQRIEAKIKEVRAAKERKKRSS